MSDDDPSLRRQLREQTADHHARVDALGTSVAAVTDAMGYRTFLGAMHTVMSQYGLMLDRSSALAGLVPRAAMLQQSLRDDLADLGANVGRRPLAMAPSGDGAAWGVGYVLEGSALGAAFLLRDVAASHQELPTSYLSLLVRQRPDRWAVFCTNLNDSPTARDDLGSEAVHAAMAVFHLVETSLLEVTDELAAAHA